MVEEPAMGGRGPAAMARLLHNRRWVLSGRQAGYHRLLATTGREAGYHRLLATTGWGGRPLRFAWVGWGR